MIFPSDSSASAGIESWPTRRSDKWQQGGLSVFYKVHSPPAQRPAASSCSTLQTALFFRFKSQG